MLLYLFLLLLLLLLMFLLRPPLSNRLHLPLLLLTPLLLQHLPLEN
jgi:hypothetical protein